MSAWRVLVSLVLVVGLTAVALGQTTVFVWEGFSSGSVDPAVWDVPQDSGAGEIGVVPGGDPARWNVLTVVSSGEGVKTIGHRFALPPFAPDDILVIQLDVRRNAATSELGFGARKSPAGAPATSAPSSPWHLPSFGYSTAANVARGNEEGSYLVVSTTAILGQGDAFYPAPSSAIEVGRWVTVRLVSGRATARLYLDGRLVETVDVTKFPDPYARADDWVFWLGDAGAKDYETCDAAFDNVWVLVTKPAILAVVDAFGEKKVSFLVVSGLYNQFGAAKLEEALASAGQDFEKFAAALQPAATPGSAPAGTPSLSLVSVVQAASTVTLTVKNTGRAACSGEATVVAGLSYATSWIPEMYTEFYHHSFGQDSLAPGATKAYTFDLPAVPAAAREALKSRLETVWTGYKDPDPKDYIGLTLTICPGDLVVGFLPLP